MPVGRTLRRCNQCVAGGRCFDPSLRGARPFYTLRGGGATRAFAPVSTRPCASLDLTQLSTRQRRRPAARYALAPTYDEQTRARAHNRWPLSVSHHTFSTTCIGELPRRHRAAERPTDTRCAHEGARVSAPNDPTEQRHERRRRGGGGGGGAAQRAEAAESELSHRWRK